ncbi:hypothetical protein CGK19_24895, partial [Vibrio parahaemolyticus]
YQELHQMIKAYDSKVSLEQLKSMSEDELHQYVYKNKELRSDMERARRIKKNHFYANSGLIKLSTVHSF